MTYSDLRNKYYTPNNPSLNQDYNALYQDYDALTQDYDALNQDYKDRLRT